MRRIGAFVPIAIGGLLALAVACGSSTQGVQASIGPSGGTLSLATPAVQFNVPAGALQHVARSRHDDEIDALSGQSGGTSLAEPAARTANKRSFAPDAEVHLGVAALTPPRPRGP